MAEDLYFSTTEEGITDVEAFFDYAGYKARDMREPLHKTKEYINLIIDLQFDSEGEARSGGWAPLSEKPPPLGGYALWKMIRDPVAPILELAPEFLHGDPGTPYGEHMKDVLLDHSSWHITMTEALYDPPSERAAWHQTGAVRSRGGVLPARPILDLDEGDYQIIDEIFWDWLDELRTANPAR